MCSQVIERARSRKNTPTTNSRNICSFRLIQENGPKKNNSLLAAKIYIENVFSRKASTSQ
jgi:hypothetical protein